jgi:TetR/AcrR family transcriptional repressor of nem operon
MARPVEFTRDEVLDKAMQAFWDHGYQGTSMADLVEATHLNPGSIYAAFQSKQGLFLAVLDHYGVRSAQRLRQALADAKSPLQGIRHYFRQLGDDVANTKGQRSCLLVNTVLELSRQNVTVQERVNYHLKIIEDLFRQALKDAQACGELPPDRDPAAMSAFLMTNIWGLRVLAGTAPSAARTRGVVKQILNCLQDGPV